MNTIVVGIAGYTRAGANLAARDSCVGCSLLVGLALIGLAVYHLYRAPRARFDGLSYGSKDLD